MNIKNNLNNQIIYLRPTGKIDLQLLEDLKTDLGQSFNKYDYSFRIKSPTLPLLPDEYVSHRNQYQASKILNRLTEQIEENKFFRILGVMDEDIYTEPLNFIFGLATLPLSLDYPVAALISITRLKPEYYHQSPDPLLLRLRTLKEAVHELGHTLGLNHCKNFCVMRFSNSLRDTDIKPSTFCTKCQLKIRL